MGSMAQFLAIALLMVGAGGRGTSEGQGSGSGKQQMLFMPVCLAALACPPVTPPPRPPLPHEGAVHLCVCPHRPASLRAAVGSTGPLHAQLPWVLEELHCCVPSPHPGGAGSSKGSCRMHRVQCVRGSIMGPATAKASCSALLQNWPDVMFQLQAVAGGFAACCSGRWRLRLPGLGTTCSPARCWHPTLQAGHRCCSLWPGSPWGNGSCWRVAGADMAWEGMGACMARHEHGMAWRSVAGPRAPAIWHGTAWRSTTCSC